MIRRNLKDGIKVKQFVPRGKTKEPSTKFKVSKPNIKTKNLNAPLQPILDQQELEEHWAKFEEATQQIYAAAGSVRELMEEAKEWYLDLFDTARNIDNMEYNTTKDIEQHILPFMKQMYIAARKIHNKVIHARTLHNDLRVKNGFTRIF